MGGFSFAINSQQPNRHSCCSGRHLRPPQYEILSRRDSLAAIKGSQLVLVCERPLNVLGRLVSERPVESYETLLTGSEIPGELANVIDDTSLDGVAHGPSACAQADSGSMRQKRCAAVSLLRKVHDRTVSGVAWSSERVKLELPPFWSACLGDCSSFDHLRLGWRIAAAPRSS
jgi:hypothetical protein